MAKIQVRIYRDGTIESTTVGIKGSACENHLRTIEQLTSSTPIFVGHTEEYGQSEQRETVSSEQAVTVQK